jgi:hypothetical protein
MRRQPTYASFARIEGSCVRRCGPTRKRAKVRVARRWREALALNLRRPDCVIADVEARAGSGLCAHAEAPRAFVLSNCLDLEEP